VHAKIHTTLYPDTLSLPHLLADARSLHGAKKVMLQPEDRIYRGTMNLFWMLYEVLIMGCLVTALVSASCVKGIWS
jgi:hypothetical protein